MVEPGEVLAELGRRLRSARRARSMSLAELAARVGTVKGYLSAIERGRRPPPGVWLAARLERALGLPRGEVTRVSAWWRAGPLRAEVSPWGAMEAGDGGAEVRGLRAVPGFHHAEGVRLVVGMQGSPVVLAGDWVIVGRAGETVGLGAGAFAAVAVRWPAGHEVWWGPAGRGEPRGRGVEVWRFAGVPRPWVGRVMPVLGLVRPLRGAGRGSGC